MALVEHHLYDRFASLDENEVPAALPAVSARGAPVAEPEVAQPPFARVNTVAEGSPAATAGLKPGDEIQAFGYVNSSNHDNLKKVGECVQGNEGVSLLLLNPEFQYGMLLKKRPKQNRETYLSEYRGRQTMLHGGKSSG